MHWPILLLFSGTAVAAPGPNPCFKGKPPIDAGQMHADLEKYV